MSNHPPYVRRFLWLILWGVAVVLTWWILQSISFSDVAYTLSHLSAAQWLIWLGLNSAIVGLLGIRWGIILRAQGHKIPYMHIVAIRLVAYSLSYFTPGPHLGGEFLQGYLLSRNYHLPGPQVAASIAVDRLIDMNVNLIMLALGICLMLLNGLTPQFSLPLVLVLALALIVLSGGLLIAIGYGKPFFSFPLRMLEHFTRRTFRLTRFMEYTEHSIAKLWQAHPLALLRVLIASLGMWALMITEYGLTFSFLAPHISESAIGASMIAVRLAILMPLPGGWGSMEAGQMAVMGWLGLDPVPALSLVLLIHLRDVVIGLIGLVVGGILMGDWYTVINKQSYDNHT